MHLIHKFANTLRWQMPCNSLRVTSKNWQKLNKSLKCERISSKWVRKRFKKICLQVIQLQILLNSRNQRTSSSWDFWKRRLKMLINSSLGGSKQISISLTQLSKMNCWMTNRRLKASDGTTSLSAVSGKRRSLTMSISTLLPLEMKSIMSVLKNHAVLIKIPW